MHVFTNVSEYLIVINPLSSALKRLSVSKAELQSCAICSLFLFVYFPNNYLFFSLFMAEVLSLESRRTSFRVDV